MCMLGMYVSFVSRRVMCVHVKFAITKRMAVQLFCNMSVYSVNDDGVIQGLAKQR